MATASLCPHSTEIAVVLGACGAVIEATSEHYAMALVRAMRAEGRPIDDVISRLILLRHAPELAPGPTPPPRRARTRRPLMLETT